MKTKYQFLILLLAVFLIAAPVTGYAQKSNTNEEAKSIFIPDFHRQILSALVKKVSYALDLNETIRLNPNISASYSNNDEETTVMIHDNKPILKPFIYKPFHNSAVSIFLPYAVTQSLSIAPAITYSFSTNNPSYLEYKRKSLINLVDSDSSIIYGGIHLFFTF